MTKEAWQRYRSHSFTSSQEDSLTRHMENINLSSSTPVETKKNLTSFKSKSPQTYAQASLVRLQQLVGLTISVNPADLKTQISTHLTRSTINFPFINRSNEFWTENIRGNNALRYTHFSLAPLLLADRALNGGENFTPYINTFAGNCRNTSG